MTLKQTAVEWLYERLERMIPRTALYNIDKAAYLEQAKEMEKEQISDAWYAGDEDGPIHDFEDYYQETFKSE